MYYYCIMSWNTIANLTPKEREESEQYLEIHRVSNNKSPFKSVAGALVQAFPGIKKHKIKSQSSSSLPPKHLRWVFMALITPGPSVEEPDFPPLQTSQSSCTKTGPVSVPYLDTIPYMVKRLSIISLHSCLSDYAQTMDEELKEEGNHDDTEDTHLYEKYVTNKKSRNYKESRNEFLGLRPKILSSWLMATTNASSKSYTNAVGWRQW